MTKQCTNLDVKLLCCYSHTYGTGIYRHMRCTAYKVAPDDGLIQSETCRASNGKESLITRILCIFLVYIHTVCLLAICCVKWYVGSFKQLPCIYRRLFNTSNKTVIRASMKTVYQTLKIADVSCEFLVSDFKYSFSDIRHVCIR